MLQFLLVLQIIVAFALIGVILMQRSEGGGMGVGGSPAGLMSARGAADFLTRATSWLAVVFVLLCIAMAAVAGHHGSSKLDTSLVKPVVTTPAPANAAAPLDAPKATTPLGTQPAQTPVNPNDPLAAIAGHTAPLTTPAPAPQK